MKGGKIEFGRALAFTSERDSRVKILVNFCNTYNNDHVVIWVPLRWSVIICHLQFLSYLYGVLFLQVCERPHGIQRPQEEKTHLPRLPQIAQFPPNAYLLWWIKIGLQRRPCALLPPLPPFPLLRRSAPLILNHTVPIIAKGGSLLLAVLLHVIPARVEVGCLWLWPLCAGRGSQNVSQEGSEIELTRFLQHSSDNQHRLETLCEDVWSSQVATTSTTTTWVVLLAQGKRIKCTSVLSLVLVLTVNHIWLWREVDGRLISHPY